MHRKIRFSPGSYFHICNRGVDGQTIFRDERDYVRFLFLLLHFQASVSFYNLGRQTTHYVKHRMFNVSPRETKQIKNRGLVELCTFAIMPNHYHALIQEKESGGISQYIQRVQGGYARYANTKYKRVGHLFQGAFRAVPVETDAQLLYLSAYIHRNPRGLERWCDKEIQYPWSSYQDYTKENRWGELLNPSMVLNQFTGPNSYHQFVETSTTKLKAGESPLDERLLLE